MSRNLRRSTRKALEDAQRLGDFVKEFFNQAGNHQGSPGCASPSLDHVLVKPHCWHRCTVAVRSVELYQFFHCHDGNIAVSKKLGAETLDIPSAMIVNEDFGKLRKQHSCRNLSVFIDKAVALRFKGYTF